MICMTWSLAIKFDRTNLEKNEMVDNCEVCFLFENAQHHILKSNQCHLDKVFYDENSISYAVMH